MGSHPLVVRALKGIRNKRPPKRKVPVFWDKQRVLDMFRHWKRPISLAQTIKKGAFLLMIQSAKRPSEVAHLLSDPSHLQIGVDSLRIIPSKDFLSKTDRHNHSCPPYFVRSCPADLSICPIETVKLIKEAKLKLGVQHKRLFFSHRPPFEPLDTPAFSRIVKECLSEAGIDAPPGSIRSVAASSALARGAPVDEVLQMGDWSCESTFWRYYSSL